MSQILRATSAGYGKQIKGIEAQIVNLQNQIKDAEKRKADLTEAKKTIDDQLPPEPAKKSAAQKPAAAK